MTVFQDNIRLSFEIHSFLLTNPAGEVLLTTSKGVYLQLSNRIILLTDDTFGLTPIGLGMTNFVDFMTAISPVNGQQVTVNNSQIQFPGGVLESCFTVTQPHFLYDKVPANRIDECARMLIEECSQRSVAVLAGPLLLNQALSPNAQSNPYCKRALPLISALLRAGNDPLALEAIIRNLLGLGIGLTPSLDDTLLGLLYGLLRLAPQDAYTKILKQTIITHAPTHTNAISAAYLCAVADGGHFERLDNILRSLSTNASIDIDPLLEIGSSSGSEMLLGLLMAAKLTTER